MPITPKTATANETPIMIYNVMPLLLEFCADVSSRDFDLEIGIANSGTFQLVMFHFKLNASVDFLPRL